MIDEHKDKWTGKVRFYALSIDEKKKQHETIKEKGYKGFRHLNIRNPQNKLPLYLGAKQVPFCVLIDKKEKVAFMGHPNWRRLDEDIQALVKGRPI